MHMVNFEQNAKHVRDQLKTLIFSLVVGADAPKCKCDA